MLIRDLRPPVEVEPVPWLHAYLRGRFDVEAWAEQPAPRPAPPLILTKERPVGKKYPAMARRNRKSYMESISEHQAKVRDVLTDHYAHPSMIAPLCGLDTQQVRRIGFELYAKGLCERVKVMNCISKGQMAWWYRRKQKVA